MNWNEQQSRAIGHRGGSLLLSAGAGSGKTAVLTERIAQLCLEGIPLSNMLVVTYTNAAAAEMKRRIQQRLALAAADETETPTRRANAQKQLEQFGAASISTLHAFCGQVLRRHFQAAGVDPAFRVADDFEAGALRRRAADEALLSAYEEGDPAFFALEEGFGGRGGRQLPGLVLRCYDFLMTQPHWKDFLASLPHRFDLPAEEIGQSDAARALALQWAERCRKSASLLGRAVRLLPVDPAFNKARSQLSSEELSLRGLGHAFSKSAAEGTAPPFSDLAGFSFGTLTFPRGKKGEAPPACDRERIKALRDSAKKPFDKAVREEAAHLMDGAFQQKLLLRSRPQAEALCALLTEFEARYSAFKAERGLLDFSDLEHRCLQALEEPAVAEEYRQRFSYVFVDEYQDSSSLQESILGSFCRDNDLFCVGDVKQSIYSFRAALPGLFLARAERAKQGEGTLLPLNHNYRTAPSLLACVNDLFSRAMQGELRYGPDDALQAGRTENPAHPCPPLCVRLIARNQKELPDGEEEEDRPEALSDAEWEALLCARLIRRRMQKPVFENGEARPARFSDFAVLLRTTSGLSEVFCRIFSQEGIPAFADLTGGYFDVIEVQVLLNLLRLCDNRRQDIPLLSVLRSGIGGFTGSDVAAIRTVGDALRRKENESGEASAPADRLSYFDALCLVAQQEDSPLGEKCRALLSLLEEAHRECRLLRLSRFAEWLIRRTGYDDAVAALPGGPQRTANLEQLLHRIRAYESASARGLSGFLTYIDEALATGRDMGEARTVGGSDCVRILSIHRSKGLEFPIVYLCGAGRGFNLTDSRRALILDSRLGLCMKSYDPHSRSWCDTLFRQAAALAGQSAAKEEELRVLYVALTRPREELTVIGTVSRLDRCCEKWSDLSSMTPSCPLDWIMAACYGFEEARPFYEQAGVVHTAAPDPHEGCWAFFLHDRAELTRSAAQSLTKEEFLLWRQEALGADPSAFGRRLRSFAPPAPVPAKTSASALSRPQPPTEELRPSPRFLQSEDLSATGRGTASHLVMERLDLSRPLDPAGLKEQICELVSRQLLTEAEAKAVSLSDLARFFQSDLGRRMVKNPSLRREQPFSLPVPARRLGYDSEGSVIVQGVIDVCFLEEGGWILLDYKTDRLAGRTPLETARCHQSQLELYAEALEWATGLPVREKYIFLLSCGQAVAL